MTDQSIRFPRFYLTVPSPCPYLPDREEQKIFTELKGHAAEELNNTLSRIGFRRSQNVAYKPACEGCGACLSARIVVGEFDTNRSMRRLQNLNRDVRVTAADPKVTTEQYTLLRRYLDDRHADGGMAGMNLLDYAAMVEETPVSTRLMEYRLHGSTDQAQPGRLIASCLTDVLNDGLSMIYSFYDLDETKRSLGTYMILQHIERAREMGLPYVYLGYWIKDAPKMRYKSRFRPLEVYFNDRWRRLPPGLVDDNN